MQLLALLIILIGAYLIDSGYRNRPPVGTVKARLSRGRAALAALLQTDDLTEGAHHA